MTDSTSKTSGTVLYERTTRPHAYFINVAILALNRLSTEKDEHLLLADRLVACTFCAFALEAFMNWAGAQTVERWDQLERLSPSEKLLVLDLKYGFEPDFSRRPFSNIRPIFRFRNKFTAHAKPEKTSWTNKVATYDIPPLDVEEACSSDIALEWILDTQSIVTILHEHFKFEGAALGVLQEIQLSKVDSKCV